MDEIKPEDVYDDYSIDDSNDPLKTFLDKDISKMNEQELSNLLSSLNEAAENPKAVKRIVSRKTKSSIKINTEDLLAKLGL